MRLKTQNGSFPSKIALHLKKVCYKVFYEYSRPIYLCKNGSRRTFHSRLTWKFGRNWPIPFKNADFQSIFVRSASAITPSEKSLINTNKLRFYWDQFPRNFPVANVTGKLATSPTSPRGSYGETGPSGIWAIGSPLTSFPMSLPWTAYVASKANPLKGAQKSKGGSKTLSGLFSSKLWIIICDNFETVYEIGCQLVLITNKKPQSGFRLVPTSVTLNDLEQRNSPFCVISPNSIAFEDD